jgi:hypothetical protein
VKLVEGISPQYLPSIKDIYGDLFVSRDLFISKDLASAFTSMKGDAFKVSSFATLPIWWT